MRGSAWIIIVAVTIFMASCLPDDQEFDIRGLSFDHAIQFRNAMSSVNDGKETARLSESDGGASEARYGAPDNPEEIAYAHDRGHSWLIVFRDEIGSKHDSEIVRIMVHELCHVVGFGHEDGNPQEGTCLGD